MQAAASAAAGESKAEEQWIKYLGVQQHRRSVLEMIKDPAGNLLKLEKIQRNKKQQQPMSSDTTSLRYMTACESMQCTPQLSFLPGLCQRPQQIKMPDPETLPVSDGFQVARPGLRDRGLTALRPVIIDAVKAGGTLLHFQVGDVGKM
jgi:hypothetical protein